MAGEMDDGAGFEIRGFRKLRNQNFEFRVAPVVHVWLVSLTSLTIHTVEEFT